MFDAIVVGARCAGSPTAMLLARRGHRVLLVDRATFPSDTISTHWIWQHGMACLKRWGLLDRVLATNCPPFRTMGLDLGAYQLTGDPPAVDGAAVKANGDEPLGGRPMQLRLSLRHRRRHWRRRPVATAVISANRQALKKMRNGATPCARRKPPSAG